MNKKDKAKVCELCGYGVRNEAHIRGTQHKKKLIDKMKLLKEKSIAKYGYFKWE